MLIEKRLRPRDLRAISPRLRPVGLRAIGIRGLLGLWLLGLLAVAGLVAAMLVGHFLSAETSAQVERQQRLRAVALASSLGQACAAGVEACDAALGAATARAEPDREEVGDLLELTAVAADFAHLGGTPLSCALRDPLVLAAFQSRRSAAERRDTALDPCLGADAPVSPGRGAGRSGGEGAGRFVVAVPVESPDGRRLVLRFGFGRAALQAAVAERRNTVLLGLLADFGAVLLFGMYLVGRAVVRPVEALTRVAAAIATEGLEAASRHAALPAAGPREIERLRAAFAEMLERLQAHDAALREKVAQLSAARDDLVRSEKLATVGRLAAGVAHEVGNPLAAVLGFVEYLRDERGVEPGTRADLLARMDRELQRIRGTIRQLLDFSRPQPAEPRIVDAAEVARAALDLVRFQSRLKTVTLTTSLEGPSPVLADPQRLQQVLVNLLLNAGDALDGKGTVAVSVGSDVAQIVLRVEDDGPGIAAEERPRVFDPFFTTKPAGAGTGLGLAISQRLVEEAGGTISVAEPAGGRGACFEIRLPRVAET